MTFIQADSFVYLQTMESKSVDAIITDVPYNLKPKQKKELHQEFVRISKGVIIVFSPPENQWIMPADEIGFWVKPISTKNTSKRMSRFVEMIFFYGRTSWNTEYHWSWYTNVFQELVDDTSLHQYRKPPALIERLIKIHTDEGHTILDPFAGSRVIEQVAVKLDRTCISIDINHKDFYVKPTVPYISKKGKAVMRHE